MAAPTYESLLEQFRVLRETEPVKIDHDRKTVQVFRYDEVFTVLTEHKDFSSDLSAFMPPDAQKFDLFGEGNFTRMDDPAHGDLRGLVSQAFTPRMIGELEARIAGIVDDLLATAGSEFDFVEVLAHPLPIIVIAELIGIPAADRGLFQKWADFLLSQGSGAPDKTKMDEIYVVVKEMHDYLLDHIRHCRNNPGDDLTSRLTVAVTEDGRRLTDTEITGFMAVLLMAGHLTTTALLCHSALIMDARPDVTAELRARRELIPQALEEFLRFRSPSARMERKANREMILGDVVVPANYLVLAWISSANRDPRQFADPDTVDIHRTPNRHLAFGKGVHFCLGAPLARLEARIALNRIFDRYDRLEVSSGPEYFPSTISAVKRLVVSSR